MGRRLGLVTLALAGSGAAICLGGAAAKQSPVFDVTFRLTTVSKSRPPNIVQVRRAGKGRLLFTEVPHEDRLEDASSGEGLVVIEHDVLSPEPATETITMRVVDGQYGVRHRRTFEELYASVVIVKSTLGGACKAGNKGEISLLVDDVRKRSAVHLTIKGCAKEGQVGSLGRRSPVQVDIFRHCLGPRATSSVGGRPLCASTAGANTWAGTWNTNVGKMTLTASGSGSYDFCNGKIAGSVAGAKLTGTWTQTFPCGSALKGSGKFEFTLAKDGHSWSGRWQYAGGDVWHGDWFGTSCATGPCTDNGG